MATFKLIIGPMFSGKSTELIRVINREKYARKKYLVIKPDIDSRSRQEIRAQIRTETGKFEKFSSFKAISISTLEQFLYNITKSDPDVVGIDEIQFFGVWLVEAIKNLLIDKHKSHDFKIIAAGLKADAWNNPYEIVSRLMVVADELLMINAICFKCGSIAPLTKKIGGSDKTNLEIGSSDIYQASCLKCHSQYKSPS